MNLLQAFDFTQEDVIAFTGAGGKTRAIFTLARLFDCPVIITTTTHMGTWQTSSADWHITLGKNKTGISDLLREKPGITIITGNKLPDKRLSSPTSSQLIEINKYCKTNHIPFLIEADGAKQKFFKAFDDDEPVLPNIVTQIVNIAGIQGIGSVINDENVHRSLLFAEISGLLLDETISLEALKKVLDCQAEKLTKLCPDSKRYLLLNQADDIFLQSAGGRLASKMVGIYEKVVIASLLNQTQVFARKHKVAAIILAAGAGSRFGANKPLALWQSKPMVESVISNAECAGLSPIIVVGGYHFDKLQEAIHQLPVKIVNNTNWQSGQSSSIQAGLNEIRQDCQGVIFMMADQPQISVNLLRALIERAYNSTKTIIGPIIDGKRSTPMYFAKKTFDQLMSLRGDTGGRNLLPNFQVEYIEWYDQTMAIDIDVPEDFRRLEKE